MEFSDLVGKSQQFNEHSDCAVKALTVACEIPYEKAHSLCKSFGRQDRGRTKDTIVSQVVESLGKKEVKVQVDSRTIRTLERELKDSKYNFLVRVRGHLVAISKGKVIDWTKNRCNRIMWVNIILDKDQDLPENWDGKKKKPKVMSFSEALKMSN